MTQSEIILKHLRKRKTITSLQAFELYTILDLQNVIRNLRKKGHNIPPVEWRKSRMTGTRYGVYKLIE